MKLWHFTLLLCASSAFAAVIPVNNASFETLPGGGLPLSCGAGCTYSIAGIPGWTNSGDSGQFRPGTDAGEFASFDTLSDGPIVAYSNGPAITQTVGVTVTTGAIYTLLVDIGWRKDLPLTGTVALGVNGNLWAGAFLAPPVQGAWNTYQVIYIGEISDGGKPMTIELLANGQQGDFDNVRFSETVTSGVPEPGVASLMGAGLALIACSRLRRR